MRERMPKQQKTSIFRMPEIENMIKNILISLQKALAMLKIIIIWIIYLSYDWLLHFKDIKKKTYMIWIFLFIFYKLKCDFDCIFPNV